MSPKGGIPTVEELKKRPAPADPDEVASLARKSLLGQSLQDALNEMIQEDAATSHNEDEPPQKKKRLLLQQHMAKNVLEEFGQTVAHTNWEAAPAALVRGRLDHYNRMNGKWRIVVRDAQWKRRETLDKNRRKTNPPPLWDATKARGTRDSISLRILAFDDL